MLKVQQEKIQKGEILSSSSADIFNIIVHFGEEIENFDVFQPHILRLSRRDCKVTWLEASNSFYALFYC